MLWTSVWQNFYKIENKIRLWMFVCMINHKCNNFRRKLFFCALCTAHIQRIDSYRSFYSCYTVYSIQYTVYSIQYTVYCILYTVYTVYSIQYTVYCTLCTLYTEYSIQCTDVVISRLFNLWTLVVNIIYCSR